MGGPLERPWKCPHDKTILESKKGGGLYCSHCGKHFRTKWDDVLNEATGKKEHTQILAEE